MGIIILGIIILVIGVFIGKAGGTAAKYKSLTYLAGVIVILLGLFTSAIRQIEPGHVGVQVLFGEVKNNVLYEGLNIVNPLVDVKQMSIQTQNYTMSATYDEGQQGGDDAIRVLSNDGLEVIIDLTVLYKMKPIEGPNILRRIGVNFQDKIIRPIVRTAIRESASYYNAVDLFAEKREEFELNILERLEQSFVDRGFILEQLLVRNINLPKSVKQSIERKITAVQEAQRMEFVLQKEKQEAERKRVEARGVADAQKIVNQGLSPKILQYEQIKVQKELVNSPNSKIILLGNSDEQPPFIIGK
jgi:regulator of protease activity HflC (stomatin/prohibitin superfamily)